MATVQPPAPAPAARAPAAPAPAAPAASPAPAPAAPGTRDRILAVALELFTEQGYEATSLREIAERLGVTKAALYYHFPSKDDIARELLGQLVMTMWGALDDLLASPSDQWPAAFDALVTNAVEHRKLVAMMVRNRAALENLLVENSPVEDHVERIRRTLDERGASLEEVVRVTIAFGGTLDCLWALAELPADELRTAILGVVHRVFDVTPS